MKTFRLTIFVAGFLLFCFSGIQGQKVTPASKKFPPDIIGDTLMKAQSTLTKLNQVELMK